MTQSTRRIVVAAAALLSMFALAAPAALAAPKEVAYRCDLDICLLDPDNPGDVTNLTFNGATSYDVGPVWSPDGKKLAFVATFNNKFPPTPNVFVMEPDAPDQAINLATEVTHYANGAVPLAELAWSPDGSKIAFARGNANPGSQPLLVAESNGTSANPLQISPHGGHPSWSPDGSKLAFWFSNQVYLKNSDGSGPETPLANGAGREPSWSPDGSRIAFGFPAHPAEFLDLHIVSANGSGSPAIVASNTQFIFNAWSPTGSQIAYRDTAPTNQEGGYVRVVNADGSGDHGLPVVQGLNFNGPAPSWSPDGARLVFHGFYFGDISTEADNSNKVYIANANGTGSVTSLTGDKSDEPAWRPRPAFPPPPPSPALPGPKIKAKVRWFTNRIFWSPGRPLYVASYACGDITCGANSKGTARYVGPPSVLFRPKKGKNVTKTILAGRGKTKIPANTTRKLQIKLTRTGVAALKHLGKLTIKLKVTIKAGTEKVTLTHSVRVFVKPRR
jgi:TolB protein